MTVIHPNSISGITSVTSHSNSLYFYESDHSTKLTINAHVNGNVTAVNGDFSGNLNVGGVLTYEDVTNIDSVGVITARSGIDVTGNIIGSQTLTFIGADTSDGSDNKSVMLGGGGNTSTNRGAYVWVKGNEYSGAGGELILSGGAVSSSLIDFYTNSGQRARITSTGELNIGGSYTQTTNKLNVTGTAYVSSDITAGDDIIAADEIRNNVPGDFWATDNTFISLNGYGNLTHQGGYQTCLTSNGYRTSTSGQWKSYAANSTTGAAQIRLDPTGYISFGTESNKSNGSTWVVTERLRIASNGKVMMGQPSSSINRNLSITGVTGNSNDAEIGLQPTNSSGGLNPETIIGATADGTYGAHMFFTTRDTSGNRTERLRITSGGLVGINCTPLAQLQVKTGTNANIALTADGSEAAIEAFNDAGSASVPLRIRGSEIKFKIDGTQRARLSYSSSSAVLSLGDESNSAGHLRFEAKASENQIHGRSNHPITFLINTAEKIRINQYGGLKLFNSSSSISGTDEGALYYNTLEKRLKVYNGNAWTNTDVGADQYWSNVVLLIAGASTIVDASGRHTLTLNGNAATSTTYASPVGNSHTIRLCPVNAGDYLNVQNNLGDFRLDDSDWTFEYWVRIVDTASSYFHIFTADGQGHKGTFKGYTSSSTISSMYFYSSQGNGLSHTTNSSFSYNTWMHVAWEFDDSADDFRLYIDGVLKETNTSMTFEGGNPTYAYFGRNTDQTNEHIEFYIDNIRWTRGVCRYNGTNFTPPTSPYPTS